MIQTYKKHHKFWYAYTPCKLLFGRYINGRPKLVLQEYKTGSPVATATINVAQDGIRYSKLNNEIVIKNWGVNDGIYERLRDMGIISKKKEVIPIGLNEAYLCELLVNPDNYEQI